MLLIESCGSVVVRWGWECFARAAAKLYATPDWFAKKFDDAPPSQLPPHIVCLLSLVGGGCAQLPRSPSALIRALPLQKPAPREHLSMSRSSSFGRLIRPTPLSFLPSIRLSRTPQTMLVRTMVTSAAVDSSQRDPNTLSNYSSFRTKHTVANFAIDFKRKILDGNVVLSLESTTAAETDEIVLDTRYDCSGSQSHELFKLLGDKSVAVICYLKLFSPA
jgi:hypothetical protein